MTTRHWKITSTKTSDSRVLHSPTLHACILQLTTTTDLLAPLTSAAELPTHPALSVPYNEKGLPEMIRKTEEALHQEQRILWKMKALFTEFRGDAIWAPVGMFHTEFDDVILGTHRMSTSSATLSTNPIATEGAAESAAGELEADTGLREEPAEDAPMTDDVPVERDFGAPMNNGAAISAEPAAEAAHDTAEHTTNGDAIETNDHTITNGTLSEAQDAQMLDTTEPSEGTLPIADGDNDSPAPSHRMTTRARAQGPTRSTTPGSLGSPQIHPFFAFPTSAIPDANLGLPINMADETRHALISYISKQEEIVRSYTELHSGLLKALEMRTNVWNWTRAEGHEGEMSDHEDWVDLERWGIDQKDFRKGMLEEDGDDAAEEERRKRVPRRVGRAAKE
jgi:hypothetical protein